MDNNDVLKPGFRDFTDLNPDADYLLFYGNQALKKVTGSALLTFGIDMFKMTAVMKNYDELDRLTLLLKKKPTQLIIDEARAISEVMAQENLMDEIKIGIMFENYMKGLLIAEGYLIHLIDRMPRESQKLAAIQRIKPLLVNDFMKQFPVDRTTGAEGKEHFRNRYLTSSTVTFKTLLSEGYQNKINLPPHILKTAEKVRLSRNRLHFHIENKFRLQRKLFEEFQWVKRFVDETVIPVNFSLTLESRKSGAQGTSGIRTHFKVTPDD